MTLRFLSFLLLIAAGAHLTACERSSPHYCTTNSIDLQPLVVGEQWQPAWGLLDEAQSNCTPTAAPEDVVWTSDSSEVIRPTNLGGLEGVSPGEFRVEARDGEGGLLVAQRGFVMPENWTVDVAGGTSVSLQVGEEWQPGATVRNAQGQALPFAWIFVSPRDMNILSQRGCLPQREGFKCVVVGKTVGETTVRVGVGHVAQTVRVTVREP